MRKVRWMFCGYSAVLAGLIGCADVATLEPAAARLATNARPRDGASARGFGLRMNSPTFSTYRAYLAAFTRRQQQAKAARETGDLSLQGCWDGWEPMSRRVQVEGGPEGAIGVTSTGIQHFGAINVWGRGNGSSGIPWNIYQTFFRVPGRFLPPPACGGDGFVYGEVSSEYEYSATNSGYGVEEEDNPPAEPPPGIYPDEWYNMNPREKALLWAAFWAFTPDQFQDFIEKMRQVRDEAFAWSATQTRDGFEDGPQDAYRHGYWACRQVQLFGLERARDWTDAHEKYELDPDRARMDLHNNAVGREVAGRYVACDVGIRAAFAEGLLIRWKGQAPASPYPRGGPGATQPPPPPTYDQ